MLDNKFKYLLDNCMLENGKLPAYAWPGGYPMFYIAADNGVLCPDCANSAECKQAEIDCQDDKQWLIVNYDINYEDNCLFCDNCNKQIESAYGPD